MKNSYIRDLLIYNYGAKCWLNGKITRDNPLTLHHIKPVREGGKTTMENGALLSLRKHEEFNKLEQQYPDLAAELNMYFEIYRGQYPQDVFERIQEVMSMVDMHYSHKCKNQRKVSNYQKCLKKRRR